MSPRSRRTISASVGLVAVLAVLADLARVPDAAESRPAILPAPRAPVAVPALKPVEAYAAIVERVLFQPSRQPALPQPPKPALPIAQAAAAAPPPPPPPPPPPVLMPMTLLAVVISSDRREAVLGLTGGKSSTLAEGEGLEGWVLAKVLPDRVVFRKAETEQEVPFPVAKPAARPPQAPHGPIQPSPQTPRPH
jgi:hypothetical protein